MPQITLASMQDCINAAFNAFNANPPAAGTVNVNTTNNGVVPVTCVRDDNQTRFNCGPAVAGGYTLPQNLAGDLRTWCTTHPGNNWSYGFRGPDQAHPNQLNITLINWNQYMFNFHVTLS